MVKRLHVASALVLGFAIAGCQGGSGLNGTNALPSSNSPTASSPGEATAKGPSTREELRSAPQGVRVIVHLPLRNVKELEELVKEQSSKGSPMYHRFLTLAQFRAKYGPSAADLQSVALALRREGFKTIVTTQGVDADAPQATVERVFKFHLHPRADAAGRRITPYVADRLPTLPPELKAVHAQVAPFGNVPDMKPMHAVIGKTGSNNRYGATQPFYWYDDLKQAYSYPSYTTASGSGQSIAIVAAADFSDADVATYFGHEGLAPPAIGRVLVDGGPPAGSENINNGLFDEVSLDVQQSSGSAPGATVTVYEAPDASFFPSFFDMYVAIDDSTPPPEVVSTSFGLCELYFTAAYNGGVDFTSQYLGFFHALFLQGNAEGISFLESSGDNGAQGGECTDVSGKNAVFGVSAWADDPNVTGVGGTNLVTSSIPGSLQSTYVSENADQDMFRPGNGFANHAIWGSGGGVGTFYSKPSFQNLVNTGSNMRTVPDVAMMMGGCPSGSVDPCGTKDLASQRSAFVVALATGTPQAGLYLFIGTSGSSPEFAGLQAIQDQILGGPAGNVNNFIYELAAAGTIGNGPIFRTNIKGNNGYPSHPGYNYVLGNGTPYAAQYAQDPFAPLAGNPQTPSNP